MKLEKKLLQATLAQLWQAQANPSPVVEHGEENDDNGEMADQPDGEKPSNLASVPGETKSERKQLTAADLVTPLIDDKPQAQQTRLQAYLAIFKAYAQAEVKSLLRGPSKEEKAKGEQGPFIKAAMERNLGEKTAGVYQSQIRTLFNAYMRGWTADDGMGYSKAVDAAVRYNAEKGERDKETRLETAIAKDALAYAARSAKDAGVPLSKLSAEAYRDAMTQAQESYSARNAARAIANQIARIIKDKGRSDALAMAIGLCDALSIAVIGGEMVHRPTTFADNKSSDEYAAVEQAVRQTLEQAGNKADKAVSEQIAARKVAEAEREAGEKGIEAAKQAQA